MYVKGLRLAGFKSFANPTSLEFEPGVNVIVGPNGSGKSNIADALQWVLGSQAPSSLRGASMEDVIFAGSAGRPRLGIAEVTLTLDNADRALPLDLSEVTISRSTDRQGATEYRINGAPCRLLDIAELLSDTGIGRSIHTVVSQGQLDAVLQARPEDRRDFIEEAAQIGKYRKRKDRSLRKIEKVEDNLVRLNDVLVELRRAIRPLKRQAEAAAAFSELMARHRDLRQRLTATDVARLEREEAQLDIEAEQRRTALLSEELDSVRALIDRAEAERDERARTFDATRSVAERMNRATDRLGSLARFAEERGERLAAKLSAETEESYRERILLLRQERERWSSRRADLESNAAQTRARAETAKETARTAREKLEETERALSDARREETAAAQALVRAEGSEAAARATVDAITARVRSLQERRDVTGKAAQEAAAAVEAAEREVRAIETDLDAATEAAAEAETRLEAAREHADDLRADMGGVYAQRAGAQARADTLQEVSQTLADHPDIVAKLQPMVERAARLVEITGKGEEAARSVLAEADAQVERIWLEVARHDEELRRLDALMSGAAERLAGARRRHESREIELATLDEEVARATEGVADAQRAATEERAAIPARRSQLDETVRLRERAEESVVGARSESQSASAAASDAEVEARSAEERVLAAQLRMEEAEAGLGDAQAALEGLAGRRANLIAARERAEAVREAALLAASTARAWVGRAEANAASAREAALRGEREHHELVERERELSRSLEEAARRRNDAEVRRAETRTRVSALGERAMDEWGMSLEDLAGLTPFGDGEEEAARSEVEKLDRDMRRLGAVNPRAAEEYSELAERETFLESQIEDLKSSRRDLLKVVAEIDATIVTVFREAFEDVAREFEGVFDRLFPGGSGRLKLLDPEDLLGSGIEIEARPPGKNVRKLSLLSGGERSLVALAFLFAIFRARPSPFYLLDEVEAALDDINLQRFLGLIAELEERAQVLIVTHQKRTMEAADVLYGVSMAKDGVSHVVAKRMEEVTL